MKKYLLLLLFAFGISAYAQQFAIKTNLLYDAAITPNIGVEVAMKERQSAQAFYGFNNWNYGSDSNGDRKARHWLLMPEYRWWQCTVMNGWFVGIHGMTGEFNVGNIETILPGKFFNGIDLQNEAKSSRFEGGYLGGGISAGYQFILSRNWNLEFEAGVGYNYVWYDQYPCAECGSRIGSGHTNYFGLTKAGLVLMYVF